MVGGNGEGRDRGDPGPLSRPHSSWKVLGSETEGSVTTETSAKNTEAL